VSEHPNSATPIAAVILAGGRATRMGGGDKPLKPLAGRPMLAHVIERLRPQVDAMVLNANGDPARFAEFGLPVVPDAVENYAGPLAGVLAGMRWAAEALPQARSVVSVAGDTPFFPTDLVERLAACCAVEDDIIAMAASFDGVHPVFGLWPVRLADELEAFLAEGRTGKILAFADRYTRINVPFEHLTIDHGEVDPFFNVNTPEEAERAEAIARALGEGRAQDRVGGEPE
jgi:molybdopterin-guanine dinucleotide biosynthesis protein A